MHRLTLLFAFVFCIKNANGQETFNRRFDFTYLGAVLTSVHPTDSCYYATGILADSVPPYATGNIFAKFDLGGELEFAKSLVHPTVNYETWFNTLQPYRDSLFVIAGQLFDSVGKTQIIKFDRFGDTVSTHKFLNPYFPVYDWMHPMGGLAAMSDGSFFVSNLISNAPLGTSDLYVMKIDGDGGLEWGSVLEDGSGEMDIPRSTLAAPGGSFLTGVWRSNMNLLQEGYTSQVGVAETGPDGTVGWKYLSPETGGLYNGANEMAMLDDGSLIIATGLGTEIERPGTNGLYFDKHVMKLNPDLEIEWEVTFEEHGSNTVNRFTNIVEVSDGSGVVAAGADWEPLPSQNSNAIRGYLAKINLDGQVAWTRRYVGLNSNSPRHKIYDIDEAPDGGFIVCGESRDGTNETIPPQQGWLLKLDEHGCLVPGCHLFDNTEEETGTELELAIYPNPTSDYLNFQLRGAGFLEKAHFRIMDAQGRVVEEHESGLPSETHIVPVWGWAPGVYFLQYMKDGVVVATERFVVVR